VKTALATTARRIRLLTADRDAESVIFRDVLRELTDRHPDRLEIRRHLDADGGFVTEAEVHAFAGADPDADFYLCGPAPFMDLTERALLSLGVAGERIFAERFTPASEEPAAPEEDGIDKSDDDSTGTVVFEGRKHSLPRRRGETLLESARRIGLAPPFSCEAGNCATCIAQVTKGEATMRVNNALDEDEVAEGWVLTCQGEPATEHVTVVYED
jgi:ferredoxin-NADP reductase